MKTIKRLLEIADINNIAEKLSGERLTEISSLCKESYESDLATCADKFRNIDEFIEIAKQVVEEKNDPWPGAANAKYPLLTVAAMQFNARAFPALVPAGNVVKARQFGQDAQGQKANRSDRVSKHMSYQLYYDIEDWVENMDQMLLLLPIVGHMFKKSYYDPLKQKVASSLLQPKKLVVNNDSTSTVESAPRVTEILSRRPSQIKANIDSGIWIDPEIKYEDEEKDAEEEVLEQHVLLDIYDDGNKEPYVVTFHQDSGKIFRIKACFDQDTILMDLDGEHRIVGEAVREIENKNKITREQNQRALLIARDAGTEGQVQQVKEIKPLNLKEYKAVCVEKIQYYTSYGYLPAFDGKFYRAGLGDLIASLTGLVDTNLNQMLDAGTLANLQGGFRAQVGKMKAGIIDATPGKFTEINTGGLPLRDSILPYAFKGPSPVLFNLLGMLIEATKDITSIKDIMVGDAPAGETATTTMIKREEGMKVFSAIYKRIYRAMSKEFQRIYTINRKYLKQDDYFRFGDAETYISKADYEDDGINIVPVADPNESTMADRLLKAQALMQFMGDPEANPAEIKKNYITAMGIDESEYERFFPGAQPAPPPPELQKLVAETGEIQAKTEETQARTQKIALEMQLTYAKALEALANAESKEIGTQLDIYKQVLEDIGGQYGQVGVPGMENTPGNGAIPQETAPGLDQAGIGEGEPADAGGELAGEGGNAVQGIPGLQ